MSLNPSGLVAAVVSHAAATGRFERVNSHQPSNAPGNGLTASVWMESLVPARSSGLASTSLRVTLNVRLYSNMLAEPEDQIDPKLMEAVDVLLAAYSGDFTLGGLAMNVDLLGMSGEALSAQAGYMSQDNKLFRIVTITLPVILSDVWDQAP